MVIQFWLLSTLNTKNAYAASLRSDRFGSDSTNDKQLSLASRVSHSGPDPESPRTAREILNQVQDDETRRVLCPHNTLPLEAAMRYNHPRNGVVGGQHPTLKTKALHRKTCRHSSFLIPYSSLRGALASAPCQNASLFTIHYSPFHAMRGMS